MHDCFNKMPSHSFIYVPPIRFLNLFLLRFLCNEEFSQTTKHLEEFLELQLHTGVISRFCLGWCLRFYLCISCSDISKIASKFTESQVDFCMLLSLICSMRLKIVSLTEKKKGVRSYCLYLYDPGCVSSLLAL